MASHGLPWLAMVNQDNTLIEVPIVLRDLIAAHGRHPRQPYYDVIEEALLYGLDEGGGIPPHERGF